MRSVVRTWKNTLDFPHISPSIYVSGICIPVFPIYAFVVKLFCLFPSRKCQRDDGSVSLVRRRLGNPETVFISAEKLIHETLLEKFNTAFSFYSVL